MKLHRGIVVVLLTVTCGLFGLISGCSSLKQYEVSQNYDSTKYRRVAILVTRMGHFYPAKVARISKDTDYAVRKPMYEYNIVEAKYQDVYIENDQRLKEAVPEYPNYRSEFGASYTFFQNITPQISKSCGVFFRGRGYEVIDVHDVAATWNPPLSEMKIGDIARKLQGNADILFVFHYMDVGSAKIQTGNGSGTWGGGLVRIDFSVAIFDVASGERLLYRDVFLLPVMYQLFHDPQVLNDPINKDRIEVHESSDRNSGTYRSDLSFDETIEIGMKYVREELSKIVP